MWNRDSTTRATVPQWILRSAKKIMNGRAGSYASRRNACHLIPSAPMAQILEESRNPFIGQIFRELRSPDLQKDRHRFRENIRLLGCILAYEMAAVLPSVEQIVPTPLGDRKLDVLAQSPILCAILRAALPFWEGMLQVFRNSDSMIVGAARREGKRDGGSMEMSIELSYRALPDANGRDWIFVDPMLATGSTILGVYRRNGADATTPDAAVSLARTTAYFSND